MLVNFSLIAGLKSRFRHKLNGPSPKPFVFVGELQMYICAEAAELTLAIAMLLAS